MWWSVSCPSAFWGLSFWRGVSIEACFFKVAQVINATIKYKEEVLRSSSAAVCPAIERPARITMMKKDPTAVHPRIQKYIAQELCEKVRNLRSAIARFWRSSLF